MTMLFISYSTRDRAAAGNVYRRLVERGYHVPFLDYHPESGIPVGSDWEEELRWQLRVSRGMVVLCSEDWKKSQWCFAELDRAKELGKAIFPLKISPMDLPNTITRYQAIDLMQDEDAAFERLWRGLEAKGLCPSDDFYWPRNECPYPGFEAFQEEHAAVYFGREHELQDALGSLQLMRKTGRPRLLFVLGPSGSGKSSFVRAGVLPRLKFNHGPDWLILPVLRWSELRPRGQTWAERLAMDLARAYRGHPRAPDWKELRIRLHCDDSPESIRAAAEHFLDDTKDLVMTLERPATSPLLVLDQFEEMLVSPAEATTEPAGRFLKFLGVLLSSPRSPWSCVATVRSDFMPAIQQRPELLTWSEYTDVFRLDALKPERLFEVVRRPAERVGIVFENDALVNRIVAAARRPDALPLLAFALREMYVRLGPDRRFTADEFDTQLGGLEGCLKRVVSDALSVQSPSSWTETESSPPDRLSAAESVTALRHCFVQHLVQLNERDSADERSDFVRRAARWCDLPVPARPLLERFIEKRLLTARDHERSRIVEVAHEALFRAWDDLRAWLDDSRDELRLRHRLREAAEEWLQTSPGDLSKRDPSYLWEGGRLEDVEQFDRAHPGVLNEMERDFCNASTSKRDDERAAEELRTKRELESAQQLAQESDARRRAEEEKARQQAEAAERLRHRAWILGWIGFAAIVLAVTAVTLFFEAEAERGKVAEAKGKAEDAAKTATDAAATAITERARAERQVCALLFEQAYTDCEHGANNRGLLRMASALERAVTAGDVQLEKTIRLQLGAGHPDYIASCHLRGSWRHPGHIVAAAFATRGPGTSVITANDRGEVYETVVGAWICQRLPIQTQANITALVAAPDVGSEGGLVITGGGDGQIHVWRKHTGKEVGKPIQQSKPAVALGVSLDGTEVVALAEDWTIYQWNIESRESVVAPMVPERPQLELRQSKELSVDGLVFEEDSDPRQLHVCSGALPSIFVGGARSPLKPVAAAVSVDWKRAVTRELDGTAVLWRFDGAMSDVPVFDGSAFRGGAKVVSRTEKRGLASPMTSPLLHPGQNARFRRLGGGPLFLSLNDDGTARFVDGRNGRAAGPPVRASPNPGFPVVSPDSQFVLSVVRDDTATDQEMLSVWSPPTELEGGARRIKVWLHVTTGFALADEPTPTAGNKEGTLTYSRSRPDAPDVGDPTMTRLRAVDIGLLRAHLQELGGPPVFAHAKGEHSEN